MRRIFTLILILSFGILSTYSISNSVCNYKMFPIFAGGSSDEFVNTIEIDTSGSTDYIYVAGKT
jgi:hypothetical protein